MDNMMPYPNVTNEKDFINMDTLECIRTVSESSMGGTSGYNSTTSPGPDNSPFSSRYSPVQSLDSALQAEFSQLVIPQQINFNQQSTQYVQLQNVHSMNLNNQPTLFATQNQNMNFSQLNFGNPISCQFEQPSSTKMPYSDIKYEYEGTLTITEQPVEKFRFRYKSEMHGTHGSLNGTRSKRSVKTFPEVQLCGYKGRAIIRCSLFQTNLQSPHSHQLVVRKDDHDICDPHELTVSEEIGYFAEFKNMGIIHTAKKYIVEELLRKKRKRLVRDRLSPKEENELQKQTEKEAKDMNLNQVRLCFEAFRVEENRSYTPIAAPIYSNPINNRKSAQTGELRILRLSMVTGNVAGGDDLILLVEKVSKKNIKVRFFEMDEDELVWEAFASFRESDVHHQYAIVCRIPAYKNKDIDEAAEVFVELVRPSDDERSPPVNFRYKPKYDPNSRKRRRTCSSLNSGSCNNSGSLSSGDLPKTIQDTQKSLNINPSDELKLLLNSGDLNKSDISIDSGLLDYLNDPNPNNLDIELNNIGGRVEKDGVCSVSDAKKSVNNYHYKKSMISKKQMDIAKQSLQQQQQPQPLNIYLQRIINIYLDTTRSPSPLNPTKRESAALQITKIINEHAEKCGDSLIHEIVIGENKYAIPIFRMLEFFNLKELSNTLINKQSQTALHYACLHGQPNYIRPLLKMGCNPNLQDTDGNTALHIAVIERQLKCVESFINSELPLNISHLNDDGFTPMHLAIRDNNYEITAKLLKFDDSSVTISCSKDGSNALHMAVQQQNVKLVNLILNNYHKITTILYANNRAGYNVLELAKQLVTSDAQAKEILSILVTIYNKYPPSEGTQKMDTKTTEDNDDEDGEFSSSLDIKEEEYSCSSTEDDEEDNNSCISANETNVISAIADSLARPTIIKACEIKQENGDDNIASSSSFSICALNKTDLEMALNSKEIFAKLSGKLNENEKWKKLAQAMEMPYFFLTNAEAFLNSLKRNLEDVNCDQFAATLQSIDKSLINLFLNY